MKKCVLVICYSRADNLESCLSSFFAARGSEDYKVVVVRQLGFEDVGDVIERFRHRLSLVIEIEGDDSAPESIRRNRFLGYFACYQTMNADLVLALEDDVRISFDALDYVESVFRRYSPHRRFRGINLGSIEPLQDDLIDTYSLLRYGIHGQASVLSRRTWNRLLCSPVVLESPGGHFDIAVESYLKTGFMVTPNNSRHLDVGYGGTHAPADSDSQYFAGIRDSWVGPDFREKREFRRWEMRHHWRDDAIPYHAWSTPYHRVANAIRNWRASRGG